MPVIGFLHPASPDAGADRLRAFRLAAEKRASSGARTSRSNTVGPRVNSIDCLSWRPNWASDGFRPNYTHRSMARRTRIEYNMTHTMSEAHPRLCFIAYSLMGDSRLGTAALAATRGKPEGRTGAEVFRMSP
jgi:hypothetical protein